MHTEVRRWLEEHAMPLAGTSPAFGSDDLLELLSDIGARIVLVGEARHDCHEHAQLRHRLVKALVGHLGFDGVAVETSLPRAATTAEWVAGGPGTAAEARAGLSWGLDQVDEVGDLLGFLRDHNTSGGGVLFGGIDVVDSSPTMIGVVGHLEGLGVAQDVAGLASGLLEENNLLEAPARADPRWSELRDALVVCRDGLADRGTPERDWGHRMAHTAVQTMVGMEGPGLEQDVGWNTRDELMADNLVWMAQRCAKVVGLAHDAHVQAHPFPLEVAQSPVTTLGVVLRQRLGPELLTIGLSYGQGGPDLPGARDPGTLDAAIGSLGHPVVAVDFRPLPEEGAVAEWARSGPTMRYNEGHGSVIPGVAFDIVVHVAEASRVRTTP